MERYLEINNAEQDVEWMSGHAAVDLTKLKRTILQTAVQRHRSP